MNLFILLLSTKPVLGVVTQSENSQLRGRKSSVSRLSIKRRLSNQWYPDWSVANKCVNSPEPPSWMIGFPDFIFDNNQECCEQHFQFTLDDCLPPPETPTVSSDFYPDWREGSCFNEDAPLWMESAPDLYLFNDLQACCTFHFGWNMATCLEKGSQVATTVATSPVSLEPYYPDWSVLNGYCKNDGKQPSYMTGSTLLLDDLQSCCEMHFIWDLENCMNSGESGAGTDTTTTTTEATSPTFAKAPTASPTLRPTRLPTNPPTKNPTSAPIQSLTACAPSYVPGRAYAAHEEVQHESKIYACKPYPFTGWCVVSAYQPGVGQYWTQAWDLKGNCVATFPSNPPPAPNTAPTKAPTNVLFSPPGDFFLDGFENGFNDYSWSHSGVAHWSIDSSKSSEGSRSARSGGAGAGEMSDLSLTMDFGTSIRILTFDYLSTVAMPYDQFAFMVDDVAVVVISKESSGWSQTSAIIPPGEHTLTWSYLHNPNDTLMPDSKFFPLWEGLFWIDNIHLLPLPEDGFESGGFDRLPWQHGGDAPWTIDASYSTDGSYSARSGAIGDNQVSTLILEYDFGPTGGTLSFDVKCSTEADFTDVLWFKVTNGVGGARSFYGEVAFGSDPYGQHTTTIGSGMHRLEWSYEKNESGSGGQDAVWLDNIRFTPN